MSISETRVDDHPKREREIEELSVDDLVNDLLESIEYLTLTVDELAVLSADLNVPLDSTTGVSWGEGVDLDAGRRSLVSKNLVEHVDGSAEVVPWLTLLVDAVGDPLVLAAMRRESPGELWEWSLFADERIGVQQQASDTGIVVWAPFDVSAFVEIVVDALQIRAGEAIVPPQRFEATFEALAALDNGDRSSSIVDGIPATYLDGLVLEDRSTQSLVIVDRTIEPPVVTEIVWARLGESLWQFDANALAGSGDAAVRVQQVSGENVFDQILAALPLTEEEIKNIKS